MNKNYRCLIEKAKSVYKLKNISLCNKALHSSVTKDRNNHYINRYILKKYMCHHLLQDVYKLMMPFMSYSCHPYL